MNTEIPSALAGMGQLNQWICWRLVPRPGEPKPAKVPSDPRTLLPVNPLDPRNWMTAELAQQWAVHSGLGVGFVFTSEDPFFFIDLDECAADGAWQPHAQAVLQRFPGAAVEVSCSWRGLHIFGRCAPGLLHSNKCKPLRAELYTAQRFVALGSGAIGDASLDCTAALQIFAAQHFPPRTDAQGGAWTDQACEGYTGQFSDEELIQRALRSKSAGSVFGDQASFADLWSADEDKLARAFPPIGPGVFDASSADLALASRLAFWTGKNCERIRALMLQSGLQRGKWERTGYIDGTIMLAVGNTTSVYSKAPAVDPAMFASEGVTVAGTDEIPAVSGYPYCGPEQLLEKFGPYVWVKSVDRIIAPDGDLLDESRFRKLHRARVYALDHAGTQTTTNAHKAFHESQCFDFQQADALTFEPGNSETLVPWKDKIHANTWRDPKPERVEGDPAPFLDHLRKLLPHGDDAEILRSYLAACVQHQGRKFAWCPLVQGTMGNGKTTLSLVLEKAIGHEYVSVLKGSALTAQFNGWLAKSVVAVVEDLRISSDKSWAMESIKPMITARRLQIERKGIDQTTENICCNFLLTSNHQDAIPLDRSERRFAIFFCAQQSEKDLLEQGMGPEYFDALYEWLEDKGGYAVTAEYLHTCEIPRQWNPARGANRAPKTSSHEEAIVASRSREAQLIFEAVEAEDPGFRGGWVSTICAGRLLEKHKSSVSPRALTNVLKTLGYVRHPSLPRGRTSRPVMQEGGRPRLYILCGHLSSNFEHMDVTDAYEKAQGYAPVTGVLPLKSGLT